MGRRERLETDVDNIKNKIATAPTDTPIEIKKLWEEELVDTEFELNNLVDGDEDNNMD